MTLAEQGLSPFPIEATTDPKGLAHLGPIAPGGATLGVRADGFVPRGAVPVADPPPPETRVALVRAGVLTGRVVDARGYPIDGATVEIVGTDPAGAPIFDDPRRSSFQAAHFDATLGGPAPLVPAGELGVMPGPVPPIPHAGVPTPHLAADPLVPPGTRFIDEPWVTRADGTFRASPASPGRVRAIIRHPQFVEAQSDLVTLLPGGEAHVDVVMHEGGALEGRVLDARDRPVEGARVVVSAMRGTLERATRSASDGTFAFASLPDEVSLTAGVDEDDAQPDVRMTLSIPEGGKKEVTVHLPAPREALAVTVVDDRDRPVDAAQVSVSSLSADAPLRTTAFTDRRGEASLKRARGIPLRVEVSAPGHAPKIVTTDGTGESLRVALSPAETATGEVVASRGRDPIPGAHVTLYTDLGVRRARAGADGTFSLNELAPGPAKLDVRAAGFAPVTHAITIPDSGGRRAFAVPRIELSAEGIVEGEVVDAHGQPVPGARRRGQPRRYRADRLEGALHAEAAPRGHGDAGGLRAGRRACPRRGREGRLRADDGEPAHHADARRRGGHHVARAGGERERRGDAGRDGRAGGGGRRLGGAGQRGGAGRPRAGRRGDRRGRRGGPHDGGGAGQAERPCGR